MLVGVIADSHDNLDILEKAINKLNHKKVDFVIHAGDFIAPFTISHLEKLNCPWIGVFGNNDGDQKSLTTLSKGRIQPPPYELNLDGKKVVVVHDLSVHDTASFHQEGVQIVIHGHTHEPEIKTDSKKILHINPGELGGWLTGQHTFVLIDTKTLEPTVEKL